MGKKRFFALVLALTALLGLCLGACAKKEPDEVLSQGMQAFADAVESIHTPITLDSFAEIDSAYLAYSRLEASERESRTVTRCKERLDGYEAEYTALREKADAQKEEAEQAARVREFLEAVDELPAEEDAALGDRTAIDRALRLYASLNEKSANLAEVAEAHARLTALDGLVRELEAQASAEEMQRAADAFIRGVAEIGEVTLDSESAIEDLLADYEGFSEELKAFGGMAEAKRKLDDMYAACRALRDAFDIEKFLSAVDAIGEVTLASEGNLRSAENLYRFMSDEARLDAGVAAAYERLLAARAAFDALFAAEEEKKIARFLAAVDRLPAETEQADVSWFEPLKEVQDAYYELAYESTRLPEVQEALAHWDAVRAAFEALGLEQIPMADPNLLYSGDVPPHLVVQMEERMFEALRTFYGAESMAALAENVIAWLDVYVDGVFVAKTELDVAGLGHIITNSAVLAILKALSGSHSEIVSGASFSFALHFEDKFDRYIPSERTKVSPSTNQFIW